MVLGHQDSLTCETSQAKNRSYGARRVGKPQRVGGGAKCVVRFWGGNRTIECPIQNQFGRPRKVGFVWSVHVSSKKNERA